MTGTVTFEASEVISLIMQFLAEQGLSESCRTISQESRVPMETVEGFEEISDQINQGHWDLVLERLEGSGRLANAEASELRGDLYEQVFLEMLESGETATARALLRSPAGPLLAAGQDGPSSARYLRLEGLMEQASALNGASGATVQIFPNEQVRTSRRAKLADRLRGFLKAVPPGRLLQLLAIAAAQECSNASASYSLFYGPQDAPLGEDLPVQVGKVLVEPDREGRVVLAMIASDGISLVIARGDGFVQICSALTGILRTEDLPWQQSIVDQIVVNSCVNVLASFSHPTTGTVIVGGTAREGIYFWSVQSGKTLLRIRNASAIRAIAVTVDGQFVRLFYADESHNLMVQTITIEDGRLIADSSHAVQLLGAGINPFHIHALFYDEQQLQPKISLLLAACSDGRVRVWRVISEESHKLEFGDPKSFMPIEWHKSLANPPAILSILPLPRTGRYILSTASVGSIIFESATGSFAPDTEGTLRRLAYPVAISCSGRYAYGQDINSPENILLVDLLESERKVYPHGHPGSLVSLAGHPSRSWLYSLDNEGLLKGWTPKIK